MQGPAVQCMKRQETPPRLIHKIRNPMISGHINKARGFTLIELLVVIAIIGILSSVVLASLNTARNRGADSAVKSNLANARTEAELYYDTNNGYGTAGNGYTTANVCSATLTNGIGDNVQAAIAAGGGTGNCVVTTAGWGASAQLKTSGHYCVDSTGVATTTSSALPNGDPTCN